MFFEVVCRELSRIVWLYSRAQYLLSSADSHMIMATPTSFALTFSVRVRIVKE